MIQKLGMPWITVSDIQAAKKFYVETMGFAVHEENPAFNWLEVKIGDSVLGIWQPETIEADKPGQNAVLTYVVDDLVTTKNMLAQKGVTFEGEIVEMPGVFKMVTFVDPDGNKAQLYQMMQ